MHLVTAEAKRWSGRRRASAAQLGAFGRQNWKVLTGERLSFRAFVDGSLPLLAVLGAIGPITPSDQIPRNWKIAMDERLSFWAFVDGSLPLWAVFQLSTTIAPRKNATLFFL